MIFRIEKNKYYSVISNYHLRDNRLSLQAKGLLSLILSFPDNCDFKQYDLQVFTKAKETAIRTALNELIELGYITKYKTRNSGKFDTIYNVLEAPESTSPDLNFKCGKSSAVSINKVNTYRNTNNKIRKNYVPEQDIPEWLEDYHKRFNERVEDL